MITYKEFDFTLHFDRIKDIYAREGWTAYLGNDDSLRRAFEQSFYILGAFDGEELAGFVRCVGDGEHIVLVQDLIIDAPYRRQKIGTELMGRCGAHFAHVRMFHVVTSLDDEADNAFYRSLGMKALREGSMISYFR